MMPQACIWHWFDCSLLLRHDELLGDRRQRFFFADLGLGLGWQGSWMFAQACAAIRLGGMLYSDPSFVNRWAQGRSRFDPEDRDLDRTSSSPFVELPHSSSYEQRHRYQASPLRNYLWLSLAPIAPLLAI